MADDDPDDRELMREAFDEAIGFKDLRFVKDGVELLDYLNRRGDYENPAESPLPALILLDLNMPRMDGRQALQELRSEAKFHWIRVIILTTSRAQEDILQSYSLSAASYIAKPASYAEYVEVFRRIGRYWLEIVEFPDHDDSGA